MVKEDIKDLNERTAIIKGPNDKAFAYAYVELREAAGYARARFRDCSIGHGISDFFHKQIPRYTRLPAELKREAEAYAQIYPQFNDRNIERTKDLQSQDNSTFMRAFEGLQADYICIKNAFPGSAFWKTLEKRIEFYQKRYDELKAN